MKTLKLLFLLLVMVAPAWAQIGGGQTNVGGGALVQTFAGVPSGTCSAAALAVNTTNGNLYTCHAGVWTLVSGGGGSGTVSSGTVNTIAKYTGTTTVGNSLLDDGLTTANTLTYSGSGGIQSAGSGGIGGTLILPEGTAATAAAGKDVCYGDSTAHSILCSFNNGSFLSLLQSGGPLGTPSSGVLTNATGLPGAGIVSSSVTATQLAAQYSKLRCEPGLGDGLNAMAAGTYLQFECVNDSGVTWTITGIHCWTDNAGTSTLNAANNAATGLLTGAVTCNNTKASGGAAGTQSATTTLASGDAISFTFVADGTSKQTTWTVSLSQ